MYTPHLEKVTNNVLYITVTDSNASLFFASNIVKVVLNHQYNYCPPHLISAVTLPCKMKYLLLGRVLIKIFKIN